MGQRLIDANALKEAHMECPENVSFFGFGEIVERFLQMIDEQPTVDAVPIDFLKQLADGKRGYYSDFVIEAVKAYKEGERRTDEQQ